MDVKNQPVAYSIAPLLMRVLWATFLVETAYVLVLVVYLAVRPEVGLVPLVVTLWILQTIKFLIIVGFIAKIVTDWAGHGAYIGSDKLTLHKGLIKFEETVLELSQLRAVSLEQGWLGRRLNYGNLELKFGRLGASLDIMIRDVHNPEKYEEALSACITNSAAGAPAV